MALGRRKNDQQVQQQMFVTTTSLRSPGHPFYVALNKLLAEAQFDEFVEKLCAPLYSEGGRPSIPPGVYFRMLLVGYFENIDSQCGIAWRAVTACRCGPSWACMSRRRARIIRV